MSTMPPDELLKLWKLEKLPLEMAMGHVLQNLAKMQATIETLETSFYKLRSDVDGLIAHTGMQVPSKGKKRRKKS
jgi:hypothetical protein